MYISTYIYVTAYLISTEFLNTSSATYLAADKLPPGPEQQAANEAEMRRQELLKQMRQVRDVFFLHDKYD